MEPPRGNNGTTTVKRLDRNDEGEGFGYEFQTGGASDECSDLPELTINYVSTNEMR